MLKRCRRSAAAGSGMQGGLASARLDWLNRTDEALEELRRLGELLQEERDETYVYVCTLCGQVTDPTPLF